MTAAGSGVRSRCLGVVDAIVAVLNMVDGLQVFPSRIRKPYTVENAFNKSAEIAASTMAHFFADPFLAGSEGIVAILPSSRASPACLTDWNASRAVSERELFLALDLLELHDGTPGGVPPSELSSCGATWLFFVLGGLFDDCFLDRFLLSVVDLPPLSSVDDADDVAGLICGFRPGTVSGGGAGFESDIYYIDDVGPCT